MTKLGINIDHVATLRNARAEGHPNIIEIAKFFIKFENLRHGFLMMDRGTIIIVVRYMYINDAILRKQ